MLIYEIVNDGVLEYIDSNPELGTALLNAIPYIEKSFKDFSKIILKQVFDPECFDKTGDLFVYIYTNMSVEDAFESMDKFDSEYYYKLPRDIRKKLSFDFMPM